MHTTVTNMRPDYNVIDRSLTLNLNNPDAERGFLSSCVLGDPEPLLEALERLGEEYFTSVATKMIWRTLVNMDGDLIDEFSVICDMTPDAIENCGGQENLLSILGSVETTINWERFLASIEKAHKLRVLHKMAMEITDSAGLSDANPDLIAEKAEAGLMSLQQGTGKTFSNAEEVTKLATDGIEAKREGREVGITVGIPSLDNITGGFSKGELIIVSARPSVGKTALALNFLRSWSIDRTGSSLMFSLEMTRDQIGERLIAMTAKVPLKPIIDKAETTEQRERWDRAEEKMKLSMFWVEDSAAMTSQAIKARARRMKLSRDIGIIIVDYCQLIQSLDSGTSREQQIAQISRDLKAVAKDLSVPVILLSQINREAERHGRAPRLSDLRESGALEQDADQVLFLHRPDDDDRSALDCIVAKNRCGATGTAHLHFTASTQRFAEKVQCTNY